MNSTEIRQLIKERIRQKGTISDAAKAIGISRGYLSDYLTGTEISEKLLEKIARHVGIEIETSIKIIDRKEKT